MTLMVAASRLLGLRGNPSICIGMLARAAAWAAGSRGHFLARHPAALPSRGPSPREPQEPAHSRPGPARFSHNRAHA